MFCFRLKIERVFFVFFTFLETGNKNYIFQICLLFHNEKFYLPNTSIEKVFFFAGMHLPNRFRIADLFPCSCLFFERNSLSCFFISIDRHQLLLYL